MKDVNKITKNDMALMPKLIPYTVPEQIPLTFLYGDRVIKGVPAEFKPRVFRTIVDCNIVHITVVGENADGLELRAEYLEYRDFPVTEWVAYITNHGGGNTPILSQIKIIDNELCGTNPIFIHGNGDTCSSEGYEYFTNEVKEKIVLATVDGTSCNGAFPYARLMFEEYGINSPFSLP